MNTPSIGQIIVTIGIAVLLCIAPFLPFPLLQQPSLHLLLTLPSIVWALYYLTNNWHIDLNRKTLHSTILWFAALLALWALSIIHYTTIEQHTLYFWKVLAVFISASLVSLYLLEALKNRASAYEYYLIHLNDQLSATSPSNSNKAITIYAGDLIPIDAWVVSGEGLVDESAITGNRLLKDKHKGMKVWAGSELKLGQLNIASFEENDENPSPTFLTQSLHQLQQLKQQLPSQHLWMRHFNNAIILAVFSWASMLVYGRYQALSSIEPTLPDLQIWTNVLTLFATLLIVACPIALTTTALAYRQLFDQLFQKGIRLQNSLVVNKIAALKSMIFSKTGVLTTGIFHVHDLHTTIPYNDFKAILLALEAQSQHPFGRAITAHFEQEAQPLELQEVRSINGLGIMGKDASGNTYMAGAYNIAAELTTEKKHSVYVLVNNELVGWLDLKDRLREEAEPCVSALKENQLKVVLLSGDREFPTQYIARKTGIEEYHFQQLPEQKKAVIQQMQAEGLTGMIVEQDAAKNLLKQVSVGITLQNEPHSHEPENTTAAHVDIFPPRLLLVNELIAMCRSLVLRVRWISIFAVIYNISVVILASMNYFSLILATICSFTVWVVTFLLVRY